MWAEKDSACSTLTAQNPLDIFVCATTWKSRTRETPSSWLFVCALPTITRFIDNVCWEGSIFPKVIFQAVDGKRWCCATVTSKIPPGRVYGRCLCARRGIDDVVFLEPRRVPDEMRHSKQRSSTQCLLLLIQHQRHARTGRTSLEWSERRFWERINTHCVSLCFVFYTPLYLYWYSSKTPRASLHGCLFFQNATHVANDWEVSRGVYPKIETFTLMCRKADHSASLLMAKLFRPPPNTIRPPPKKVVFLI